MSLASSSGISDGKAVSSKELCRVLLGICRYSSVLGREHQNADASEGISLFRSEFYYNLCHKKSFPNSDS